VLIGAIGVGPRIRQHGGRGCALFFCGVEMLQDEFACQASQGCTARFVAVLEGNPTGARARMRKRLKGSIRSIRKQDRLLPTRRPFSSLGSVA